MPQPPVKPLVEITDLRLEPYLFKMNHGGYDIYKRSKKADHQDASKKIDYNRFVSHAKDIPSAIHSVVSKKIESNDKRVGSLIEFYTSYKKLTEEIREVFDIDYRKQMDALKKQVEQLTNTVKILTDWKEQQERGL